MKFKVIVGSGILIAFLAIALLAPLSSDSPSVSQPTQKAHMLIWDAPTWNGNNASALASNPDNWEDGWVPDTGEAVVFNNIGTSKSCTWDIAKTFAGFYINATYTGTITLAVNIGVASFHMASGTFTGSTSYYLSCSGDFIQTGGVISNNVLVLNMTGTSKLLSPFVTGGVASARVLFHEIHILGAITLTQTCDAYDTLIIDSGKSLSIASGATLKHTSYLTALSNAGTITGTGTYSEIVATTLTYTFGGSIQCPVRLFLNDGSAASRTLSLGSNTSFASNLLVDSEHGSYTLTVNGGASNYKLEVGGLVTIGIRGIISTSTSTWIFQSIVESSASSTLVLGGALVVGGNSYSMPCNFDTSNGTFTPGTNTVYLTGKTGYAKLKSTQQFDEVQVYTALATKRLYQSSGRLADHLIIGTGATAYLEQNTYVMDSAQIAGTLVQNGYRLNISGAESTQDLSGTFDGGICLNGTAESVQVAVGSGMGSILANKTINLTMNGKTLQFNPQAGQYVSISGLTMGVSPSWTAASWNGADPLKIVTLGDSLTNNERESHGGHSWPYYLNQLIGPDYIVVNKGLGGSDVDTEITNLATHMAGQNADIVILMIGHNDLYGTDLDTYAHLIGEMETLINAILAYGVTLYVSTVIGSLNPYPLQEQGRCQFNDWIMAHAGITGLNTTQYFPFANHTAWSDDAIHLSESASLYYAQVMAGNFAHYANTTVNFTVSGLDDGTWYRLYIDGVKQNLLIATGGTVSFTYDGPWSSHQIEIVPTSVTGAISGLVSLIFLMFAIGVVVGIMAETVITLRKEKVPKIDTLVNMLIFIVIGMASIGILYSIVT